MMKKFFFKRLKYYFLLMLIPTIILFFVSAGITVYQEQQSLCIAADNSLDNVRENIDLVIKNALQQHDLMSRNPQLSVALQKILLFSPMEYSDFILRNNIKAILSSVTISNPYISSIYLYLNNYDSFMASTGGVQYLEDFYDASWYDTYLNMPQDKNMWIEARQVKESSYSPPTEFLTIYQRMTFSQGVIVANIDINEFTSLLSTVITQDYEDIYLLNENREVLSSYLTSGHSPIDFSTVFSDDKSGNILPKHRWMTTSNGLSMLTVSYYDDFDIYLVSSIHRNAVLDKLLFLGQVLLLVLLFNCILIFFLAYETTKRSFAQINHVILALQNAEKGIYPVYQESAHRDEFDVIMNNVISLFLNTTFLNSQLQEQKYEKEAAELAALQLQINPHFLFNTLQTLHVEALKLSCGRSTTVNQIIDELSDILKYSLADSGKQVTLKEEISYLKKYLSIQHFRFGNQFVMYFEIEPGLEKLSMMRLLLQPLVENSIQHGIRPLKTMGFIKLKIFSRREKIHVAVIDTGVGLSKAEIATLYQRISDRNSRNIGLTNIHRRLILRYGAESGLHIQGHRGMGCCVSFVMPAETAADSS